MSDEINKVRAIAKLSSAIGNIDEIAVDGNTEFTGKLRRDLVKICNWFAHHTGNKTREMCKRHEEAYIDLIHYWIDGIDDYVEASSETKKHLSLFYCKAVSAKKDLEKLSPEMINKIFMRPIISKLDTVLDRILKKLNVIHEDLVKLEQEVTAVTKSVIAE